MKAKPKKPTIAAISKATSISRQSISAWIKDGLDLGNKRAVAARVAQARARETGREDYQQARLRKISAEADRQQIAAKKEAGELVFASGIMAQGEATGRAIRQMHDRLTSDLPPMLAGRNAGEIARILKTEFRLALQKLADSPNDSFLKI